ncbi:MAG: hypothetical protein NTU97_03455 [Candidatus Magasanikbacteria bacterium]|nr:hypothetical protein [Candidatus Magasanikbacteria bacterium]
MEGKYTTWEINNLTKQKEIKIAIVYDKWFAEYGGIPKEWIGVGKWKITNNIVCRYDTVTFYAVDPTQKDDLIKNLKTYSPLLSQEVMQSGDYTK